MEISVETFLKYSKILEEVINVYNEKSKSPKLSQEEQKRYKDLAFSLNRQLVRYILKFYEDLNTKCAKTL